MHNLKEVRKDFENFKKSLENRSVNIDYSKLENLDKKNREFIQIKENLEKEKKEISKSKDKSLFEKSKKISKEIEDIIEKQNKVKLELDHILSDIPNIPHKDVPIGKDENDNIEISKTGKIPEFNFKPKAHYELGEKLGMLDFDLATKTSGSRFVFVKNKLALLERALSNFMLDTHINKIGYIEISPPLSTSLFSTNIFSLTKLSWLIPKLERLFLISFKDSFIDKSVNVLEIFSKFSKFISGFNLIIFWAKVIR